MLCLGDIQLFCKVHTNLNTFKKSRLFVIPAEDTGGIDELIDFQQGLTVHKLTEFLEAIDFVTVALAGTHMLHL